MTKININDPEEWSKMDWDEPAPLNIKSDRVVAIGRAVRIRNKDLKHKEKVSKSISDTYLTPEGRALQAKKASGPNSKEHNEKVRQARLGTTRNSSTKLKIGKAQIGNQKHAHPLITEHGIFGSLKLACKYFLSIGIINPAPKIRKWIKEKKPGYYYITKEEYEQLKNK